MQCYQYLAAVIAFANTIESLPGKRQKLPYGVIADWMEENDIEPEDLLRVTGPEARTIVDGLIENSQPQVPRAA